MQKHETDKSRERRHAKERLVRTIGAITMSVALGYAAHNALNLDDRPPRIEQSVNQDQPVNNYYAGDRNEKFRP